MYLVVSLFYYLAYLFSSARRDDFQQILMVYEVFILYHVFQAIRLISPGHMLYARWEFSAYVIFVTLVIESTLRYFYILFRISYAITFYHWRLQNWESSNSIVPSSGEVEEISLYFLLFFLETFPSSKSHSFTICL